MVIREIFLFLSKQLFEFEQFSLIALLLTNILYSFISISNNNNYHPYIKPSSKIAIWPTFTSKPSTHKSCYISLSPYPTSSTIFSPHPIKTIHPNFSTSSSFGKSIKNTNKKNKIKMILAERKKKILSGKQILFSNFWWYSFRHIFIGLKFWWCRIRNGLFIWLRFNLWFCLDPDRWMWK